MRISGAGFTDNLIRENATCLFRTSNNERYGKLFILIIIIDVTIQGKITIFSSLL